MSEEMLRECLDQFDRDTLRGLARLIESPRGRGKKETIEGLIKNRKKLTYQLSFSLGVKTKGIPNGAILKPEVPSRKEQAVFEEAKTWQEWNEELESGICDPDGFRDGSENCYTKEEFLARLLYCTVTSTQPVSDLLDPKEEETLKTGDVKVTLNRKIPCPTERKPLNES